MLPWTGEHTGDDAGGVFRTLNGEADLFMHANPPVLLKCFEKPTDEKKAGVPAFFSSDYCFELSRFQLSQLQALVEAP